MSKKFYAVNRETGEKWKPVKSVGWEQSPHQYLVMFDSGYLAVVTQDFYSHITPLDPKIWQTVIKENLKGN